MRRALPCLLALMALGCGSRAHLVGIWHGDGFHPVADHYRVRYDTGAFLMPLHWRLTNFSSPTLQRGSALQNTDLFAYYQFVGGDSARRPPSVRLPLSDLRFEADGGAEIWCRSLVVDDRWAERPLAALVRASLQNEQDAPSVFGRRFPAPRDGYSIDEQRFVVVGGRRGYAVFFHEQRIGAQARRGVIVIVDTHGTYQVPGRRFPVAVVLGLRAPAHTFEQRLGDFESLARRVDFRAP